MALIFIQTQRQLLCEEGRRGRVNFLDTSLSLCVCRVNLFGKGKMFFTQHLSCPSVASSHTHSLSSDKIRILSIGVNYGQHCLIRHQLDRGGHSLDV